MCACVCATHVLFHLDSLLWQRAPSLQGFDRLKATRALGKHITHSPSGSGESHIPTKTFRFTLQLKQPNISHQSEKEKRRKKCMHLLHVALDFKHSIISFPHVENNAP